MNLGKSFIMMIMMLALTGFVMAETNDTTNTTNTTDNAISSQALQVRYDHLNCKVDFTDTQIDLFKQYVSTIDQTANKDKLVADMSTLKTFVDSNNKDGFDSYVTGTLQADLQNATQDLNSVKKSFKQYNLTNESKTALLGGLKDAKQTYSACIDDKEIKMAQLVEKHTENWDKQWGDVINKMTAKNITMDDAVALQKELEAKNAQLSALIASGNITAINDFMKTYNEDQLHFPARFELARLSAYKEKLAPLAERYNMTGELNNIDSLIANAQNYAQPGYKFQPGEFNQVWQDIKDAGKDMQNAAKDINAERAKQRQQNMANRQQIMVNRTRRMANRTQRMPPGGRQGPPGQMPGSENLNNSNTDNTSEGQ